MSVCQWAQKHRSPDGTLPSGKIIALWGIDHTLIDTRGVGRELSAQVFERVTRGLNQPRGQGQGPAGRADNPHRPPRQRVGRHERVPGHRAERCFDRADLMCPAAMSSSADLSLSSAACAWSMVSPFQMISLSGVFWSSASRSSLMRRPLRGEFGEHLRGVSTCGREPGPARQLRSPDDQGKVLALPARKGRTRRQGRGRLPGV